MTNHAMNERQGMSMQDGSAELRSHGVVLRSAADDVGELSRKLHHRIEELRFSGPAAERFRTQMREREARLSRVSHELDELAGLVQQYGDTLHA
jgi:hypothetical protein